MRKSEYQILSFLSEKSGATAEGISVGTGIDLNTVLLRRINALRDYTEPYWLFVVEPTGEARRRLGYRINERGRVALAAIEADRT